jgi:hypothetical protein
MIFGTVYTILLYTELASALAALIILFFISAPYGRHYRRGWGFTVNERFAWIFMESPALVLIPLFLFIGRGYQGIVSIVLVLLWELHYLQRTLVYPLLFPKNRKNFPLLIACIAFAFNLTNGYIQGYSLFIKTEPYRLSWLLDPRFLSGAVIFIAGYAMNLSSDKILRELRQKNGEGIYGIPHGGLFRLVSSPNYLGEMIEWIGWALLTWSLAGVVFAVFTIGNLFPRAVSHHRWYRLNFPGYPKERKAIIPFLF